jgi:hypothetical protein
MHIMAGLVMCRQGPERRPPGSDRVAKCVAGQTGECSNSTVTPGWYTERLPGLGTLLDRWQSVVSSPPSDANSASRSRDNCLGVDALAGGQVEVFGLRPDGHGNLAAVLARHPLRIVIDL